MISGLASVWKGYLVISRYLAGGTEETHAKPVRPRLEVGTSQYKSETLPLEPSRQLSDYSEFHTCWYLGQEK
jgi:hypothetical protein